MTEIIPWPQLESIFASQLAEFRRINSGMHIALLGTTRGGKTTLATGGHSQPGYGLLSHFPDVLVVDSTGDPGPIKDYGKPLKKYGKLTGHQRLSVSDMSDGSREKIYRALQRASAQGNICVYIDETRQIADRQFFNLQKVLEHIWLFTAKKGVSMIGGTQAPRWVPSPLYDQSKVHFIFGMRDRRAMKRLAEISGDVDTLEQIIPNLQRYQFAYVGIDGDVLISKYELPTAPKTQPKKLPVSKIRFKVVDKQARAR